MPKRLAVIPARGGSKRIPNKNIRDFCGKPMISHVLSAAEKSALFQTIHVSTDSETIAGVVRDLGFSIDFMRSEALADDHTPIMPVLRYVLEQYALRGETYDQVWLLMACSPLIQASDLIAAASVYDNKAAEIPLLAVCEYPVPVEWAFTMNPDDFSLVPREPGMFAVRSQDLGKKYYDAGAFSVFPNADIAGSSGAGTDGGFIGYPLSRAKAIDIDNDEDWQFAELLFRSSGGARET